jgi:hypothetical protein
LILVFVVNDGLRVGKWDYYLIQLWAIGDLREWNLAWILENCGQPAKVSRVN